MGQKHFSDRPNRFLGAAVVLALFSIHAAFSATDGDGDGFSFPEDCNDGMFSSKPGGTEVCDGWDNNCDGRIDEGCALQCPSPIAGTATSYVDGSASLELPDLAGGDLELGLTWVHVVQGVRSLRFRYLDRWGGSGQDPVSFAEGTVVGGPSIAASGDLHAVTWMDDRSGNPEIWFAIISNTIIPPLEIPIATGTATHRDPAIGWNGENWGVAWVEGRHSVAVHLDTLDTNGALIDETTVSVKVNDAQDPAVASDGSGFGVAWIDDRDGTPGIFFRGLDGQLSPLTSEVRVDPGSGPVSSPKIGWNGANWVVAWVDSSLGGADVRIANVDAAGNLLGASVAQGSDPGPATAPAMVFTDQELLVGWLEGNPGNVTAYLSRVDGSGVIVENAAPVAGPATFSGRAGLAWDGDGPRFSWLNGAGEVEVQQLLCCGDSDGDGYDRCVDDCDDGDPARSPNAVERCDGIDDDCNGLVDDGVSGCTRYCSGLDSLSAPVVHRDGTIQSTWDVSVAFDGDSFGLVWGQDPDMSSGTDAEVVFRRLDPDGVPMGDPIVLTTWPEEEANDPVICATPDGWAVAWLRKVWPYGLSLQRLLPDGTKIGTASEIDSNTRDNDALVWDGHGFGAAWDYDAAGPEGVRFHRFSESGVPIGEMQYLEGSSPDMVWTGQEYLFVMLKGFNESDGVWMDRLDAQGRTTGSRRRLTGSTYGSTFMPDIAWNGNGFGLVFVGNYEALYFQAFDGEGNPTTTLKQILFRSFLTKPEIVWTGEMYILQFTAGDQDQVEVQRVDEGGTPLGSTLVVSDGLPGTMSSFTRTGLALGSDGRILSAFHRSDDPEAGVWSRMLGCCSVVDNDQDGSCLADCDNNHPGIYPGAPEICDGLDNDCDGAVIGEGPFEVVTGFGFSDSATMTWSPVNDPNARYDLQRGDLEQLRREFGDFTDSMQVCLVADTPNPQGQDPEIPAAGAAWYYLSSAGSDRCNGDFNSGGAGQAGDRNGDISISPAACP